MRRHAQSALFALLLAQPALSSPTFAETSVQELEATFSSQKIKLIRRAPEKAVKHHVQQLLMATKTGRLTEEIIEIQRQLDIARFRARFYGEVLAHDLDGDLSLDVSEIAVAESHLGDTQKAELTATLALGDLDGDGALSTEEVQGVVADLTALAYRANTSRRKLMVFDDDGDGGVTPAEVEAVMKRAAEQMEAAESQPKEPSTATRGDAECGFPQPSDRAEIVLLSGSQGGYVSPIALLDANETTSAATLVIEEGDTPIYLVATTTTQIIWRLKGAVNRVEAFVTNPHAGVTGIDRSVVRFAESGRCVPAPLRGRGAADTLPARELLAEQLGREVDHLILRGKIGRLAAPAGIEELIKTGPRRSVFHHGPARFQMTPQGPVLQSGSKGGLAPLENDLLRQFPGGVADLDAEQVIASRAVAPYQVLPGDAGLLQLVREGKLQLLSDGYLRIVEPIPQFPAGLAGAHSTKFILGKGVPMPAGDPMHSSIYLEATGECVTDPSCR